MGFSWLLSEAARLYMHMLMNLSSAGNESKLFWRHVVENGRGADMVSGIEMEDRRLEIVIGDGC